MNEDKEIHAHKVIYADDGTYVSQTKEGMQKIANAIADFSTATGIIVKPEKSYVYSNIENVEIKIDTYKGNGKYKLGQPRTTTLVNVTEKSMWRHLGNIQNANGTTVLGDTVMYDGTKHQGIMSKINTLTTVMQKKKLSGGGALRAISCVLYPKAMYPLIYSNAKESRYTNKIQNKIDQVLKKKMHLPQQTPRNLIHAHGST